MKKNMLFVVACCAGMLFSCGEDVKIGAPIDIMEDYTLPQEGASDAANQRIMEIFEKYGTYVLYDFTNRDASWNFVAGTGNMTSVAVEGDPQYVDAMLDYLNDIWLQFFPDDFLARGGIPYRVFLADSVYDVRSGGRKMLYDYQTRGNALLVAGLNSSLLTMDAQTKTDRKNDFISAIWDYYIAQGLLSVPAEFYEGTNYNTMPEVDESLLEGVPDSVLNVVKDSLLVVEIRERGFLPGSYSSDEPLEWISNWTWDDAVSKDLQSYMLHILQRTDEQMEEILENPKYTLIRQKWDILIDFYRENYGLELRKIANAIIE